MMIKQKDFQRIMISDELTKQLIENRLTMKNLVRNARVTSIAQQLDKNLNRELVNPTPKRAETQRNAQLNNGQQQNFEEEYMFYRKEAEKMRQKKEEERQEESLENKKIQQANGKLNSSPKFTIKKKLYRDVMIKGFQEQLKLNMVKKFNSVSIQNFQNHVPSNLIENIDTNFGDVLRKINLKQQHNKDIRLTQQQKGIYQRILLKRQVADQEQKSYDQKAFTNLVSCTSFDHMNKSSSFYFNGSHTTRDTKTPISNQRLSTPEVFLKKSFTPKYQGYFKFDSNMNQSYSNNDNNMNLKSSFTISNQQTTNNNFNTKPLLQKIQQIRKLPQVKKQQI